ncbi:MAG: 50S ribosomal protein L22 [Ignisphaera sp.]|nr:50S ribosomal protein L22 [Ignisphaera sp.]MCX8168485.1 50S ribosomal protein L22 [Ignisphaera sp.]MDW8085075.1 50S ribosomal protein L22 [Ignisphaera sp.]
MPIWKYPKIEGIDESRVAKAVIRDAPISFKESYEVCKLLRGMMLIDAKDFLRRVVELKEAVPYVRYKLSIAHRRGLSKRWKRWGSPIGRYPVKAARYILELLDNVENNAIVKGLNGEKLKIVHVAAHRGYYLKRWVPRAFGRATPRFKTHTTIEVIVAEV